MADESKKQIFDWLTSINLADYFENFIESGYDDFNQLKNVSDSDITDIINDVGLNAKRGHEKRFICCINALRNVSKNPLPVVHDASYVIENEKLCPINITYKCVVNPKRKSGCYQQEIKTKEFKRYVKVEACLCNNEDFCNSSRGVPWECLLLLSYATLVLYILSR